jgi:hypothetical protein
MIKRRKQNKNLPRIAVPFTFTDRILEIVSLFILLLLWGATFYLIFASPDYLGKFNNRNSEELTTSLLVISGGATIAILICGITAYNPRMMEYPVQITEQNAAIQYFLAARRTRIINVLLIFIFCMVMIAVTTSAKGTLAMVLNAFMILAAIAVMGVLFYFERKGKRFK